MNGYNVNLHLRLLTERAGWEQTAEKVHCDCGISDSAGRVPASHGHC